MFSGDRRASGTRAFSHTARLKSSLVQPDDAAVAACSGPKAISGSPPRYRLLEPVIAAVPATVVTMPSGVAEPWSLILCGPSDAQTVTVDSLTPKPLSTANGSQGDATSFSAMQ